MPSRIITNSFVGGEIAPELYGRHDLKGYFNGAASLSNFIVRRTGGIRKRPGTNFLCNIDADAEDTLGNKYRVFDFLFDSDSFGLLALRLTTDLVPQARFYSFAAGTNTSSDWVNIDIDLHISTVAELDEFRCRQIGDTLFFTREGHQAFKCVVVFADLSISFEPIPSVISVDTPPAMTAVCTGFGDPVENDGYVYATKIYALYGVKDGVFSQPQKLTIEDEITLPWKAGAKVTLSGTLDFDKYDYYVIAKKTGVNFGKLSEMYPEESDEKHVPATVYANAAYREDLYGHALVFSENLDALFSGNYALRSSDIASVLVMDVCYAIQTDNYTAGVYRFATPSYTLPAATARAQNYAVVCMNQQAVSCYTYKAHSVAVPATTAFSVTPYWFTATACGILAAQNVSASAYGELIVGVDLTGVPAGDVNVGFVIATTAPAFADCAFLGKVFFVDSLVDSTYIGATSVTETVPQVMIDEHPAEAATMAVAHVLAGKWNGTPVTTFWNSNLAHNTVAGAGAAAADSRAVQWAQKQVSKSTRTDISYHLTAAWIGTPKNRIRFTVPDGNIVTSLEMHFGAKMVSLDGQVEWEDMNDYVTMSLYAKTIEDENLFVKSWLVRPQYVGSERCYIEYPEGMGNASELYLQFSDPVPIRGIEVFTRKQTFEFIDDNLLPGAITGIQERLIVGDAGMDARLFDVVQQRSVFAASEKLPFTLWFSAVGDLYNFYANRPQADNDPFSVTISATKASAIRHVLSARELLLFTEDGVYSCSSGTGEMFSFRTITMKRICGASAHPDVAPFDIDGKTIFVGDDGRTVYELKYNLMDDAIIPSDRSVMAYHLTENRAIVKMVHQRFPESVVWFLLDDGTLLSLTYMPEQEVFAWAHHDIATVSGKYKLVDIFAPGSKTVVSGAETTSDIVLVFETRDSGGVLQPELAIEKLRCSTCADTLAALDARCADHVGAVVGTDTTPVDAVLVTLRPETQEVSTQGIPKRVVDSCIRIRRTGKLSLVPFDSDTSEMELSSAVVTGLNIALASKDIKIMPAGFISDDGQLQFESDDIYPCEILSAVYTMDYPE